MHCIEEERLIDHCSFVHSQMGFEIGPSGMDSDENDVFFEWAGFRSKKNLKNNT